MNSLSHATFTTALDAAREAAGNQAYPAASLFLVATPIGNLADIGLRALHVLALADRLACEDTRHTQGLLRAYGIERPSSRMLALHQHNEREAAEVLLGHLAQGERIAYVSDAGTPGVSDPGARLVAAVQAAGHRVIPIPGASSVTTLICAAGLSTDEGASAFVFEGFLPAKSRERAAAVERLAREARPIVLLEAPHRIEALAQALAPLGGRRLTVGRELTKQFEQIHTLACADFTGWLAQSPHHTRGEFALVLHAMPLPPDARQIEGQRVLALLLDELPLKRAARLAAEITGASRNELYAFGLAQRQAREGEEDQAQEADEADEADANGG